jgi:DNA-binding NtrC family response regulator
LLTQLENQSQLLVLIQVGALSESRTLADAINEVERQMIQDALRRSSGNIARAAKALGLTRRGLYMKMDRLNFKA